MQRDGWEVGRRRKLQHDFVSGEDNGLGKAVKPLTETDLSLTKISLPLYSASSHICNPSPGTSGTGSHGMDEKFRRRGCTQAKESWLGTRSQSASFRLLHRCKRHWLRKEASGVSKARLCWLCSLSCPDADHKPFSCDLFRYY